MQNYIFIETSSLPYYAIDLVIAIALLAGLKVFFGLMSHVSATEQLSRSDNPAFGISLAGAALAIAILLMGVVSGESSGSPWQELIGLLSYGLLGLGLMWLTQRLFDRISMPGISIQKEIQNANVAAGLVDAGNMIATAIMLRAVMVWVEEDGFFGLGLVLAGYLLSQLLLIAATLYRVKVYARRNRNEQNASLQQAIADGNIALALRFMGHRIGIGLSVTASSGIVLYSREALLSHTLLWAGMALLMTLLLTLTAILMRMVVLAGIDVSKEVDQQANVAVGVVEAAIYIATGLLLAGLFG